MKWFPILALVTLILLAMWLILLDVTVLYMLLVGV